MPWQIDKVNEEAPPGRVNICVTLDASLIQDKDPEEQQQAIREGLIIRGYITGDLSMGEVAEALGLSYVEALDWFSKRGIATWQEFPPETEAAARKNMRRLAGRLNIDVPE